MVNPRTFAVPLLLLSCVVAAAKDKKKMVLPADVLQARTVLVIVDPAAALTVEDPRANRAARENVETALMRWGRFSSVMDASSADLIIMVRKGNGRVADENMGGIPINNRPLVVDPSDSGGQIGARHGTAPGAGDPTNAGPPNPHPEIESGSPEDTFVVYRGGRDNPLDSPAVWRYSGRNALESPNVPAVEEFRKLIAKAEKQQAAKP